MLSLLLYPDPVEIPVAATEITINAPVAGAKLVSAYLTSPEGTQTPLTIEGVVIIGGVYKFIFDRIAFDGHTLITVFEDPDTEESFAANKSFVFITNGFIPSCECGCSGNAPIKAGEFIQILVDSSIDESGSIKAVVQEANRDRTNYVTWAYTLGIQSTTINLTKAVVKGFGCC